MVWHSIRAKKVQTLVLYYILHQTPELHFVDKVRNILESCTEASDPLADLADK